MPSKRVMQNESDSNDFNEDNSFLRTTDRQLPIANVSKIMKKPIPPAAKVSKESKELMQRCASEFIAIVTCRAKEICESEARKTVTGEDLIRSMEDLDMPYYSEITKKFFEVYKEALGGFKSNRYQTDGINFNDLIN